MISLREETSTVQSLKDEFTQRIAEAERKAQLACKERDIAKKVFNKADDQLIRLLFILCHVRHQSLHCRKLLCMFLLQEIKGLREDLATRFNSSETLELIREKEEQIIGLLEEGKTFPICDLH